MIDHAHLMAELRLLIAGTDQGYVWHVDDKPYAVRVPVELKDAVVDMVRRAGASPIAGHPSNLGATYVLLSW